MTTPATTAGDTVALYSGGMDSEALRHLCNPDRLLYIDLHTAYSATERARLPADVEIWDFPLLGRFEQADAMVPLRNAFLALLGCLAGTTVLLGATAGDRPADKSVPFAPLTSALATYCLATPHHPGDGVRTIQMPLKHLSKRQLVEQVVTAGVAADEYATTTYSCYTGDTAECGECKACARKWLAFAAAGYPDAPPVDARPYIATTMTTDPTLFLGRDGEAEDYHMAVAAGHL